MAEATKPCPKCGETILAIAKKCRFCRSYLDPDFRRQNAPAPNAAERILMPVGRTGSAIAAGYLTLFSVLPLIGAVTGLLALAYGIRALRQIREDPTLSGKGRAWFGIIVGGTLGVLQVFITILAFAGMILESQR